MYRRRARVLHRRLLQFRQLGRRRRRPGRRGRDVHRQRRGEPVLLVLDAQRAVGGGRVQRDPPEHPRDLHAHRQRPDGYSKLFDAFKAGNGPDVFNCEYDMLPEFVSQDLAANLTSYIDAAVQSELGSALPLTTLGGSTWAVPIDVEPDRALVPRRPVQEVRPGGADHLGAVPVRGPATGDGGSRREARRAPDRRPALAGGALRAGRRPVVLDVRRLLEGQPDGRGQREGRLLLAEPGRQEAGTHRDFELAVVRTGLQQRHRAHPDRATVPGRVHQVRLSERGGRLGSRAAAELGRRRDGRH